MKTVGTKLITAKTELQHAAACRRMPQHAAACRSSTPKQSSISRYIKYQECPKTVCKLAALDQVAILVPRQLRQQGHQHYGRMLPGKDLTGARKVNMKIE